MILSILNNNEPSSIHPFSPRGQPHLVYQQVVGKTNYSPPPCSFSFRNIPMHWYCTAIPKKPPSPLTRPIDPISPNPNTPTRLFPPIASIPRPSLAGAITRGTRQVGYRQQGLFSHVFCYYVCMYLSINVPINNKGLLLVTRQNRPEGC